jgi:hypothetical protein
MNRRAFLGTAGAFALAGAAPRIVTAQGAWPSKPIHFIVPFPPAGGTDVLSRTLAQAIAARTKWVFVVDNKPGAGGNIGLEATAKSPADGYTIAMGQTANLAVNPALYAKMPFDPLKDFAPIALVSSQPLILVVASQSPHKSVKDIVVVAQAKPGSLNMGSPSNGTMGHIAGELFQRRAGVKFTHIPYKGAGAVVTDLMGAASTCTSATARRSPRWSRAGARRDFSEAPREAARGADDRGERLPGIRGCHVERAARARGHACGDRRAAERRGGERAAESRHAEEAPDDGSEPLGGSPRRFAEFLQTEHMKWGSLVRAAGIRLD